MMPVPLFAFQLPSAPWKARSSEGGLAPCRLMPICQNGAAPVTSIPKAAQVPSASLPANVRSPSNVKSLMCGPKVITRTSSVDVWFKTPLATLQPSVCAVQPSGSEVSPSKVSSTTTVPGGGTAAAACDAVTRAVSAAASRRGREEVGAEGVMADLPGRGDSTQGTTAGDPNAGDPLWRCAIGARTWTFSSGERWRVAGTAIWSDQLFAAVAIRPAYRCDQVVPVLAVIITS